VINENLNWALDPVLFAREALHFNPDPWQERVLRWAGKQTILNCCRQSGKSTVASILAVHRAVFYPESLILLVSSSLRQSSELFRKVANYTDMLPERLALLEDNKLSSTFSNRSRIVSLPSSEATVRGFSGVDLIIEDEASRVDDSLYSAVRPMLAVSGGRLILMSTPFGCRGHFYTEWTEHSDAWERIEIPASQVPRISAAFLASERASLGQWLFDQEYSCLFGSTSDTMFSWELLRGMEDPTVIKRWE
jgi:Terminase large subunit, T4likevirus-type, N-terminal